MRVVVQRVLKASVSVEGNVVGRIGAGLLVLLAAADDDGPQQVRWMAEKLSGLRIFSDETGKMNLSLGQVGGEMLIVSQFTLYGDCRKGRRPSYAAAASPEKAGILYADFVARIRDLGVSVQEGIFGAMMQVESLNDGPVTLIVDSP
jgi:D-tyrosyl-tRNA(Tyr) deacylase